MRGRSVVITSRAVLIDAAGCVDGDGRWTPS